MQVFESGSERILWGYFTQVHTQIIDEAANFRRIAIPGRSICRSLVPLRIQRRDSPILIPTRKYMVNLSRSIPHAGRKQGEGLKHQKGGLRPSKIDQIYWRLNPYQMIVRIGRIVSRKFELNVSLFYNMTCQLERIKFSQTKDVQKSSF